MSGSPRLISKTLTSLVETGKLTKKVSGKTIEIIIDDWKASRPKPKVQEIPVTPNELGLKIPNEYNDKKVIMYDKNSGVTLEEYTKEHPEIKDKIKDLDTFEEVKNAIVKDHYDRRHKVAIEVQEGIKKAKEKLAETTPNIETPEVKPIDKNEPARELLEQTKEEKLIPDSVWDEIFGKPQTREQILEELNRAKIGRASCRERV